MSNIDIAVFNIGMGQSILIYPRDQKDHACLVDCGSSDNFCPDDFIEYNRSLFPVSATGKPILGNLVLTNYDHDHFSAIDKLRDKVHIETTSLAKNISTEKLKEIKDEETEQLKHVCELKDTYVNPAPNFQPIYKKTIYSLENHELESDYNTNHLSQIVFIEYGESKVCIAGDLEKSAWEIILQKEEVQNELRATNIFVAPHHGRENGFSQEIFEYCSPEVIIISDKNIVHQTQEGLAQLYSSKVSGIGINFDGSPRKVLTTRNDGHILISLNNLGARAYGRLQV